MWSDFRLAARTLRKTPGFTAVAIATLALAIGATTAVFSLVDAAILRPLAYRQSGRLYVVHETVPKFAYLAPLLPVNGMHYLEWRKRLHSFERMAIINEIKLDLTGSGEPETVSAGRVTPGLFHMLGVQPRLGRLLLDEEDHPGRDHEVLISDGLWRRRFGADPSLVGRAIQLNGAAYQVAGVLPPDFHFPKLNQLYALPVPADRPEIWKPFALRDDELEPVGDFNYVCIAALAPGVSPAQAESELNALQASIDRQAPEHMDLRAHMVGLQAQISGRARGGLELILAAVAAVLLIACVNIANLLLVRASGRRREFAVRSALGAGTARLVRQMLAESILIAGVGGALGMAIAYAGIRAIVVWAPVDLPRLDEVRPDLRLLAFNFAVSLAAGLLFGLLPAWRFARADPQEGLKTASRGSTASHTNGRLREVLVSLEVGLSALCLIAAGLLLHSFIQLLQVDKGFRPERILTVDLSLPGSRYPTLDKRSQFERLLLDRVAALPGVVSAGMNNQLPLAGEGQNNFVAAEGSNLPMTQRPLADVRQVNPEYFRTLGIPLHAGRVFDEHDRDRQVVLISDRAAAVIWPHMDPLGKRMRIGADTGPLVEVVGVVGDIHGSSLSRPPSATVYIPYWRRNYGNISLAVRTAIPPAAAATALRSVIRALDSQMPVPPMRTMDDLVAESVAPRRFQMTLVLLFAGAALLLASIGIYGVVSFTVGQRTNEMGIRMALGARPAGILLMVLRQGMAPVAAGLAVGVAASQAVGRVFGSLLFGVTAGDPATIFSVVALLASVAVAATCIPARRATRIDPARALREE